MLAAYYGHAELVKFLIQHGADPNRLNDRLQSPLAGAVFKKEDSVIEVSLISYPPFFPHCVLRWCRGQDTPLSSPRPTSYYLSLAQNYYRCFWRAELTRSMEHRRHLSA